jgi:AcrR family transcriptional regulator
MAISEKKSPKQRIYDAALRLFSKKGFSTVGVREIAQEAEVNLSMISYYYNGKIGILKEMVGKFYDRYFELARECTANEKSVENQVQLFIREVAQFFKSNIALVRIVFSETHISAPIIDEIKINKVIEHKEIGKKLFYYLCADSGKAYDEDTLDDKIVEKYMIVIYPALITMIYSHFMMKPILQEAYKDISFNDAFYKHYAETIATLFSKGFSGIKEKILVNHSKKTGK